MNGMLNLKARVQNSTCESATSCSAEAGRFMVFRNKNERHFFCVRIRLRDLNIDYVIYISTSRLLKKKKKKKDCLWCDGSYNIYLIKLHFWCYNFAKCLN